MPRHRTLDAFLAECLASAQDRPDLSDDHRESLADLLAFAKLFCRLAPSDRKFFIEAVHTFVRDEAGTGEGSDSEAGTPR